MKQKLKIKILKNGDLEISFCCKNPLILIFNINVFQKNLEIPDFEVFIYLFNN